MGEQMTHDWIARAKRNFKKRTGQRPPRFTKLITVSGTAEEASVHLAAKWVISKDAHPSKDGSAFEAWCLVLRYWAGAPRVVLDWDEIPEGLTAHQRQKYQQFLYRVVNFRSLFTDWFAVAEPDRLERCLMRRAGAHFYLNSAGTKEHPIGREKAEDILERALRNNPTALIRHLGFTTDCSIGRQFPVGVFSDPIPSEAGRVFPGGFMDLLCVDGAKVGVFELKAGGTPPVGTLSELIFYVSIIRDLITNTLSIEHERDNARPGIRSEAFEGANEIIGVMIGHQLPSWLSQPAIFETLNAAAKRWGNPKVSFRADRAEGDPPSFFAVAP